MVDDDYVRVIFRKDDLVLQFEELKGKSVLSGPFDDYARSCVRKDLNSLRGGLK